MGFFCTAHGCALRPHFPKTAETRAAGKQTDYGADESGDIVEYTLKETRRFGKRFTGDVADFFDLLGIQAVLGYPKLLCGLAVGCVESEFHETRLVNALRVMLK